MAGKINSVAPSPEAYAELQKTAGDALTRGRRLTHAAIIDQWRIAAHAHKLCPASAPDKPASAGIDSASSVPVQSEFGSELQILQEVLNSDREDIKSLVRYGLRAVYAIIRARGSTVSSPGEADIDREIEALRREADEIEQTPGPHELSGGTFSGGKRRPHRKSAGGGGR